MFLRDAVAVITGTFNPVHKAHINLGKQVLKKFPYIKKIIYVPVGDKYIKNDLSSAEYRYNMLKKVCENIEEFEVSRIEIENKKQLYTYQTLDIIKKEYEDSDIYLVIGSDNLKEFHTWKRYKYILENYNLIVFSRNNDCLEKIVTYNKYLNNYISKILFVTCNKYLSISSTQIRKYIKSGIDFKKLVPKEVYDYIMNNNIYLNKKERKVC